MSLNSLYKMPVGWRIVNLWFGFMLILWTVFVAGLIANPQAWINVQPTEPEVGWSVFWYIIRNNFLILSLIIAGNLFVRFGNITPSLMILGIQAIVIGWTAGTNGFLDPFHSPEAANIAFLRIGLWEVTAYILICAITLSKSLLVADTFPAKKWAKITQFKDVTFTGIEIIASMLSVLALLIAAYIEAFLPFQML